MIEEDSSNEEKQMTSPKEALEAAHDEFGYLQFHNKAPNSIVVDKVDAAIPIAELHKQAMDLIQDVHTEDERWWKKRRDLIRQLEALK